jgi:hypothetical protein
MKRSGFKRKWIKPRADNVEDLRRDYSPDQLHRGVIGGQTTGVPVPKAEIERDAAYRRLVASLPCIHCGVQGYSQAAHGPAAGKAMKCSDRILFPLCCDRPGVVGCHQLFDSYRLFDRWTRAAKAQEWAEQTRQQLEAA